MDVARLPVLRVFEVMILAVGQAVAHVTLANLLLQTGEYVQAMQELDQAFDFAYTEEELTQVIQLRILCEAQTAAQQQIESN